MQSGPILTDTSERSWFTKLRLPIATVQLFTPCHWSDFQSYICEDDYFRYTMFKERMTWLQEQNIVFDIRYDTINADVEETSPRVYRLFTAFTNTSDALGYKLRWL